MYIIFIAILSALVQRKFSARLGTERDLEGKCLWSRKELYLMCWLLLSKIRIISIQFYSHRPTYICVTYRQGTSPLSSPN